MTDPTKGELKRCYACKEYPNGSCCAGAYTCPFVIEKLQALAASEERVKDLEKDLEAEKYLLAETQICAKEDKELLEQKLQTAQEGIQNMINEIGVPQPGTASPLANAYWLGKEALSRIK